MFFLLSIVPVVENKMNPSSDDQGLPLPGVHVLIAHLNGRRGKVTKKFIDKVLSHSLRCCYPKEGTWHQRFLNKCRQAGCNSDVTLLKCPVPIVVRSGTWVRYGPLTDETWGFLGEDTEDSEWNALRRGLETWYSHGGNLLLVRVLVEKDGEKTVMSWSESIDPRYFDEDKDTRVQAKLLHYFR